MRFGLLAFGLVFSLSGCATQSDSNVNSKYGDMSQASAKRVSGSTLSVCTADGVSSVFGLDDDQDGYAIVPESSDIYADNSSGYADYVCINLAVSGEPKHYIAITDDLDVGTDCNDAAVAINPSATEVCDTVDNNCDDSVDESGGSATYFADADSDTYGNASATSTACSMPTGYVVDNTDCDDTNVAINPGATEVCDALDVDEDCDTFADDDDLSVDAASEASWYHDADGDTYGDPAMSTAACDADASHVADRTDCDDTNVDANPGETEILDNAVDEDCSGTADMTSTTSNDADADGYDSITSGGNDCDDTNAAINPSAAEVSFDGEDNNCDGAANGTATGRFCATPESNLLGFSWEFWGRDATVDPDGTISAGWAHPGINSGMGEVCGDLTVVDGNSEYFNGLFDIDGDLVYGEQIGDGDGVWLFMDVINAASITVDGYSITIVSWPYSTGWDGQWIVDTQ